LKVNEKISKYMQNSEPLTLAVAILLKIGEKHKAAASFSLDSFLDELYNDFDSGNLKLVSPLRGFGHVEFPYQEAENITKQLFHYKLIPDYVFETPDSLFYEDDEWEARYSPSSNPEKNELNLKTENIVSPTPKIERPAITVELVRKYLKNKGGRATLKQIQSRFKGYAENTCDSIFALISNSTGSDVLLDVSHKNVSGYTAYIYEPRQYFSAAADGKGGLVVLDRNRNPVKPRE